MTSAFQLELYNLAGKIGNIQIRYFYIVNEVPYDCLYLEILTDGQQLGHRHVQTQFSEVGYSITKNIKEKLCYYDAVIVIP